MSESARVLRNGLLSLAAVGMLALIIAGGGIGLIYLFLGCFALAAVPYGFIVLWAALFPPSAPPSLFNQVVGQTVHGSARHAEIEEIAAAGGKSGQFVAPEFEE